MQRGRTSWRTDTLIRRALSARNEESRWAAIRTLHKRGTREVLEKARALCSSDSEEERVLGADILGQVGTPDRVFPKQASAILRGMLLRSETSSVLSSALYSLGHSQDKHDDTEIALIASFKDHDNPDACWFEAAGESGDPAYLPALEKHLQAASNLDHVNKEWLKELERAIEFIRQEEGRR